MKIAIPDGWMSAVQIAQALGFTTSQHAIYACRRAGLEEFQYESTRGNPPALFRRDEALAFIERSRHEEWLRSQGLRQCSSCGEWKDEASQFYTVRGKRTSTRCIPCEREHRRGQRGSVKERSASHPWKERWGRPQVAEVGSLDEYVSEGDGPSAEAALIYACLDYGYSVRPIPRDSNRRQEYCRSCTAGRCFWHPERTPAQIR